MAIPGRAPAVVVDGLTKTYGTHTAVDNISFQVDAGEVFALLGPNGAGKTTTVEMLEGFRHRDSGRVSVLGMDPSDRDHQRDFRERLGVVLQELAVEPFLTVEEVLARSASYYPRPRDVGEVVRTIGLEEKAKARVKSLSGGQQRRLDLGLGIIGNPELLFLDEPTTGFDPSARRGAWEVVRNLVERGTTVILTTHYMDEAEALADRLAVIADGRIVASGTPDSIGGRAQSEATIRFRLPGGMTDADLPADLAATRRLTGSGAIELSTDNEIEVVHRLTGWAIDNRIDIEGLTVSRLTLEDIYLRLTTPGYEDEPQA
ncbi:MAG TPA: ABC transporter ATP-binding protein, partial [Acidimicrobiales bacterium]|nr:ABC transporter ATP-binding protein [Acidimicrobiales bacterium]